MVIWPMPGVSGQALSNQLREVSTSADNVSGLGGDAEAVVRRYVEWVGNAHRMLRTMMRPEDLRRYVLTDRYWATLSGSTDPELLRTALTDEMTYLSRELEELSRALSREVQHWESDRLRAAENAYVVPDTNVFMQHPAVYREIDWHQLLSQTVRTMANIRVLVPLLVIEELDGLKRSNDRTRARLTLRDLYDDFGSNVDNRSVIRQTTVDKGEVTIQLLLDPPAHARLPSNDEEIVDRALGFQSFIGHPVEFATYDTSAAFRASAVGLRQHRLLQTGDK